MSILTSLEPVFDESDCLLARGIFDELMRGRKLSSETQMIFTD